jgi:pyruvate/2-oxoglutarate dehydrogenase complex dihydrolipoamide acyltransferase (E2) component
MSMPQHSILPFSLERKQIVDFLRIAKAKHTAYAILEIDITGIRDRIRKAGRKHKKCASLTGYLLYCFAQAVASDKMIQAYKKGSKLIVFDDVDVSTMVERTVNDVQIPVSYIIRKANEKSVFEITAEINIAKKGTSADLIDSPELLKMKKIIDVVKRIGFLRRWFLKRMFKDPFLKKKLNGTVGFSSMGMFSYNLAGWVVPITPQVLTAMVGGIRVLAGFEDDQVVKKEFVDITISMDHDILDGAQTARFIERFRRLLLEGIEQEASEFAPEPVVV